MRDDDRVLLEQAVLAKHAVEELLTPIADGAIDSDRARCLSEQLHRLADMVTSAAGSETPCGTFSIETSFRITGASRELRSRLAGHQGRRQKDLGFVITALVTTERLDDFGSVTDLARLQPFATYLKETFDHQPLSDVLGEDPTNERLARHLGVWLIENIEPDLDAHLRSLRVLEPGEVSTRWERPTL